MRNVKTALFSILATASAFTAPASAAIYFSDGFETQTDPLGTPPTGLVWSNGGIGDNYDLTTVAGEVGAGTTSLKVIRDGSLKLPNLTAVGSTAGVGLAAGNTIEYAFKINTLLDPIGGSTAGNAGPTSHNFNGPIQITLLSGQGVPLARIGTIDGNNQLYGGSNSTTTVNGAFTNGGTTIPNNTAAYDTLRAVLTITNPDGVGGDIGGTYDLFASYDGGAESLIADDLLLRSQPTVGDYARPVFSITRGPFTSMAFIDDVSIADVVPIPEPTTMTLVGVGACMLLGRRKRRSVA